MNITAYLNPWELYFLSRDCFQSLWQRSKYQLIYKASIVWSMLLRMRTTQALYLSQLSKDLPIAQDIIIADGISFGSQSKKMWLKLYTAPHPNKTLTTSLNHLYTTYSSLIVSEYKDGSSGCSFRSRGELRSSSSTIRSFSCLGTARESRAFHIYIFYIFREEFARRKLHVEVQLGLN